MRADTSGAGETREFFDKELTGFSIDSRTVAAGQMFFALSAEDYRRHFFTATSFDDGHRFIPAAFERGAAAVVARRVRIEGNAELESFGDRLLLVDDVIEALQQVAHGALKAWGGKVVALTGSAGKTTAKDLTAHVLAATGRCVLKTQKNFNNELGLALSILQMETGGARAADFDVAVLEMGQSMFGEIARLAQVAPPDIAVELNVAPVHLEFFDSVEHIAAGKAQLVENLKPGGTAILNADDARVAAMRAKHRDGEGGRTLTFGIEQAADVTASGIESARFGLSRFRLRTPRGEADAQLSLPGRHNLLNALAAAAVATCFEIEPEEIASALGSATASEMRGVVIEFAAGFSVIDDSYNSNPRSLLSMARSVADARGTGGNGGAARRTFIVAGEMLELGETGAELHREAGREIARMGIDVLWGVRGLATELVAGARAAGLEAARFFETTDEAAAALTDEVRAGDLLLVKGSRGVHTERVIEVLRGRYEENSDE
ncbi:MAG: UDP-N-acetylmuramoyl-tripeptide--D-alanyl-D-alanine ligase [Pyrinomonadaceae bacterium]|jgi:UDP-N-acetylmuramoyl-tripeptide--D-alanyl-D-alanine ligase|nr:UDP-N-acetylmuramoyl-tripeptide--D-alanyl-D-alanine ligase [Pyrinomonadaceae bacterium]